MAEPAHDEPDSPSDATTNTEVDGDDSLPTLPSAKQVLTYIPGFIWRVVVPAVVLTIFLNIPFSERTSSSVATLVAACTPWTSLGGEGGGGGKSPQAYEDQGPP